MRIRCPGCGKFFVPRGLSQHLAKSQDLRCQQSSVQRDSVDAEALGPIHGSQDLRIANQMQSRDGMSCDTLRFTGTSIDQFE